MKGTPLVLLSKTTDITKIFTAFDSPVWRAKLWGNPYEQNLSFMAENDPKYNRFAIQLENVIIDFIEYLRVFDYRTLRRTNRAWMLAPNDPSILFIHFEFSNPPSAFMSFVSGIALGFSYGPPALLGEIKTYPVLLAFPEIEDQADHFVYQKMKFSSGQVSIDNSTGMLDELFELFGNDLSLLIKKNNKLNIVRQFFIEKYTIGLSSVVFSVKGKRSRLTFKAPNTYYTRDEFPFIDESLENTVIQDAYGNCRMALGTCLNRNQIYNPPLFEPANGFNNWFTFKFARIITSIEQVMVYMSDVWTEVFPGLGIPPAADNPGSGAAGNASYLNTNPSAIRLITIDAAGNDVPVTVTRENMNDLPKNNDGRIQIWWSQAMRDNPGFLERRNGNANRAAMTGVFVDFRTPGDIVRDMMSFYGALPYDASYFNLENWEREMGQRHANNQIGLVLDRADNIFNWIEQIQNGALLGFQLVIYKNLFSARVDNPNRTETFDIKWHEIVNRDELQPEMGGEMYATYTKINWWHDYANGAWETVIDKSQRLAILDIYKFEKEYANDTFLVNEADVIRKGSFILESFMQVRPIIRNIELKGLWESEISLFSTGWIDFSVKIPRQMKLVQKFMKERNSVGRIRVKVLGWRRDYKLEKIFVDVIQADRIGALE